MTCTWSRPGRAGSIISEWGVNGTYYRKFQSRMRAALSLLRKAGKVPLIYMWYTLGLNDANAGTPEPTWLAGIQELHARMRSEFGYFPIFMPHFMPGANGYAFNDSIDDYAAADNMLFAVDSTGCTLVDGLHWDYSGMKLLAQRLTTASEDFGFHENYQIMQFRNLAGGASVELGGDRPLILTSPSGVVFTEGKTGTFTVRLDRAPVGNLTVTGERDRGDVTRSPATLGFTAVNFDQPKTVTLASADDGVQIGDRSAVVDLTSPDSGGPAKVNVTVVDAQAPVPDIVPFRWKDFASTYENASYYLVVNGGGSPGGNATVTVDATKPFTLFVDWLSAAETNAAVWFLDDAPSTDFSWSSQVFVSSVYNTGSTTWVGVDGSSQPTNVSWTPVFPARVKVEKSGNDLQYSKSDDGGITYQPLFKHVGRLTGKTTLYPRVVFATPAVNQKIGSSYDNNANPTAPPINVQKPVLGGSTVLGESITSSQGTWGGSPTQFGYQWKRNGAVLAGETTNAHVVVAADQSRSLTCVVTATNGNGSTSAESLPTAIPGAPLIPVVWGALASCDSPSAGAIRCTGTATAPGGTSTVSVTDDVQSGWSVEMEYGSQGEIDAVVVMVDFDSAADYGWGAASSSSSRPMWSAELCTRRSGTPTPTPTPGRRSRRIRAG